MLRIRFMECGRAWIVTLIGLLAKSLVAQLVPFGVSNRDVKGSNSSLSLCNYQICQNILIGLLTVEIMCNDLRKSASYICAILQKD